MNINSLSHKLPPEAQKRWEMAIAKNQIDSAAKVLADSGFPKDAIDFCKSKNAVSSAIGIALSHHLFDEAEALGSPFPALPLCAGFALGALFIWAAEKLARIEADPEMADFDTCMVKTHLSLSHDPERKGRPRGWRLPVRDVLIYRGAGFVVPVAGDIKLMPGTGSDPAFRRIDIDTATGQIKGLF